MRLEDNGCHERFVDLKEKGNASQTDARIPDNNLTNRLKFGTLPAKYKPAHHWSHSTETGHQD